MTGLILFSEDVKTLKKSEIRTTLKGKCCIDELEKVSPGKGKREANYKIMLLKELSLLETNIRND
jgi:hypothetical protein